jgi:hypothetical protein
MLVLTLLIIFSTSAATTGIAIEEAEVVYDSNVTIMFHYNLNLAQKIKAFLFGASYIEDEIVSLLNTSNFTVKKVDFDHAEFSFPILHLGDCTYFAGVELNVPIPVVTLIFGNSSVKLFNLTKIPQIYFCD